MISFGDSWWEEREKRGHDILSGTSRTELITKLREVYKAYKQLKAEMDMVRAAIEDEEVEVKPTVMNDSETDRDYVPLEQFERLQKAYSILRWRRNNVYESYYHTVKENWRLHKELENARSERT